ncbi:hypothetical protein OSH11_16800 [Kaistia dalseonensis]|uniref:Uncharacterized protein n=1 Tax=Kaistia dalseonensis TaxID=410840 RepID=A0ABU0HAU8_9HYPH|nr:hypothetical protein [Kaistia dalseonensis]MCX5496367.1 hypothetical protein [Kaistia dalseonensis]MDQ0438988.1 hypothetical protein [Kaistia dalseonensis]
MKADRRIRKDDKADQAKCRHDIFHVDAASPENEIAAEGNSEKMYLCGAVHAIRHVVEETGNGDEQGQEKSGEQGRPRQSSLIGKPAQSNAESDQASMHCRQEWPIELNESRGPAQADQDGDHARAQQAGPNPAPMTIVFHKELHILSHNTCTKIIFCRGWLHIRK